MLVAREAIVSLFVRRGDARRARLAEQALPPDVDPVASAGVLSWLGLDPRRIDLTLVERDPDVIDLTGEPDPSSWTGPPGVADVPDRGEGAGDGTRLPRPGTGTP